MEGDLRDWKTRKSIRRLRETIQCILGLKRSLNRNWAESVCRIVEDLIDEGCSWDAEAATKCLGKMCSDQSGKDDIKREKIQGEIASLGAHLSQLDLTRRRTLNELLDLKGNIRVFCRIKPSEAYGKNRQLGTVLDSCSNNMVLKITETTRKCYDFDQVFHACSTQEEVFSEIEPVIKSALDGYNVCIFAYGQTGSGKTFTMEGELDSPGVIPRAIDALFEQAQHRHHKIRFSFSMLEIHMSTLKDLLVPQKDRLRARSAPPCLSIKTDSNGGVEINNLVAVDASSSEQVNEMYRLGTCLRTTASTLSNVTSSRSHCLVRITMTSFNDPQRRRETNKIWMVDLGGSERVLKTQATGKRLEEGKAINLSLSALGDVINALQRRKPHIPYRNSKLTQILKDSLGEDSKTLMLVHVSPREEDLCETVCSLGFATRVRSIHLGHQESKTINRFESECQAAKREICRLTAILKALDQSETMNTSHIETPHLSDIGRQANNYTDQQKIKNPMLQSRGPPRFMKPTICSKLKMGLDQSNKENEKKIQNHPKRRKCSSVYAESITTKLKISSLGCSSKCSISRTGSFKWNHNADTATVGSQDASECDIKTVIFPDNTLEYLLSGCDIEDHQEHAKEEKNQMAEVDEINPQKENLRMDVISPIEDNQPTTHDSYATVTQKETPFQESNMKENISIKHVCETEERRLDVRSSMLNLGGARRALLFAKDLEFFDGKKNTYDEHRVSTDGKENQTGNFHFMCQIIKNILAGVLFASGLKNIGLGDDFYYGLTS